MTTTTLPIHPGDTSLDLRAPSIPPKRFKTHLFRYGYIRRSGRHHRPSLTEHLRNPRPDPEFYVLPNPLSPTPPAKQHLYTTTTDYWRWVGYTCPCCYLPEPRARLLQMHELHVLRRYLSVRERGWKANVTPESRGWGAISVGLGLESEESGNREEEEEEEYLSSEDVWGRDEGRWGRLVDDAVGRWEGGRRKVVEGWEWVVCNEDGEDGGEEVVEGEWVDCSKQKDWQEVDWDALFRGQEEMLLREGFVVGKEGKGNSEDEDECRTVSEWTDCGSEI